MRRSPAEQAKLDALLTELFERLVTFNSVLGLKLESLSPPSLRLQMRPDLVGHFRYGRLHGGVISATLDTTAGMAVMRAITEKHPGESADDVIRRFDKLGTIDLRVDYLRQGIGQHFVASAEVLRLGGRLCTTQMRMVNDEGTLIATATAAYIVA